MSAPKQKVIERTIARLEAHFLESFTPMHRQDYLNDLDRHLKALVSDEQLTLIQDVLNNLPKRLMPASQFLGLIGVKQKAVFNPAARGDGKDWARAIYARFIAGEKPTAICVKWAKEVLEKLGEIDKVAV